MQKVCAAAGGVKGYVADPTCLLSEQARQCPFCPDGHRLRRHGSYLRYFILPDPEPIDRVVVLRLLCSRVGRTVSLLPDFCLPRRQYGPAFLAIFIEASVLLGLTLLAALKKARAAVPGYQVGQALLKGFASRDAQIRAYLAGLRARALPAPNRATSKPGHLAPLVSELVAGFGDAASAFLHHGRGLHDRFKVGLA